MTDRSSQSNRLAIGGLIDRGRALPFTFDGKAYRGYAGDTLASALLANGVALVGRSFKYHRPRGILCAGPEEPNALVELRSGARREPNTRATVAELYAGLTAESQNRWPSLAFDVMSVNNLAAPFIGAGFYYKTFMWPASFWEKVYEPLIRRAAGLGRASREPDPDTYERSHLFCDVLVIGGGAAGLAAALAASRSGARVVLCEQDFMLGGQMLSSDEGIGGKPAPAWVKEAVAELESARRVRILKRTTVFGLFDHGECGAVERVGDHLEAPPPHTVRQRYWKIVAKRIVLAAGAIERPIVFPGNDRPGVMTANAVRTYIERYAALPGKRAVVFTCDDSGWSTVRSLRRAGATVEAIVDTRTASMPHAEADDIPVVRGGSITATHGRLRLHHVEIADAEGRKRSFNADLVAMAGGWDPAVHMTSHLGGKPRWDEKIAAFVPGALPAGLAVVGAAAGRFGTADALTDGTRAGNDAARDCGYAASDAPAPVVEGAVAAGSITPFWHLGPAAKKSFVDFQNDVTAADIKLAAREGYRSVEHAKRYTTLGMATDQGKSSGVNGLALLAAATNRTIAETGTTTFRPPFTPVAMGAIAGHDRGRTFRPSRYTPTHVWAAENGATFVEVGQWYRAQWYARPGEAGWRDSVDREAMAVRNAVGVCDVSTLGKIEVTGPDSGRLLDLVYANAMSSLKVGRVRYGVMLREDGHVYDDGTIARLAPDRFFLTTTTAHAESILRHLEFCHQVLMPSLDVAFIDVTDRWAQLAVAGPKSRELLGKLFGATFDLSTEAFPFLSVAEMDVGGVPARLYRISFSGELAYELAVPADYGDALIRRLTALGTPLGLTPYGTEAMSVLRVEKGFPAGGELNGQTTPRDLGLAGLLSQKKDYIGRVMQERPALVDPERPVLVSFAPVDRGAKLTAGSHFLDLGAVPTIENDQGHMTSAIYSPTFGHALGLGFLKRGAERIGQRVRAYDPVRGGDVEVEVGPACRFDPTGGRARV